METVLEHKEVNDNEQIIGVILTKVVFCFASWQIKTESFLCLGQVLLKPLSDTTYGLLPSHFPFGFFLPPLEALFAWTLGI
jgi:hypothetical protein